MKYFLFASIALFLLFIGGIFLIKETTGNFFTTNDFYFHFFKAQGNCFLENYSLKQCTNYYPLFSFVSSFFSQSELIFILFPLFLVVFVIPFLIYNKTKSVWGLLIYFSSSFLYNVMFASIFAQALFSVFFVLIVSDNKGFDVKVWVWSLFALLSHANLFFSIVLFFIFKLINFESLNKIKSKLLSYAFLHTTKFDISFLLKLFPLPLFYQIFQLNANKFYFLLALFFASISVNPRVLHLITLCCSLWLPEIIEKKEKKFKFLFVIICIFYVVFQFFIWFYDIFQTNLSIF